MTRQLVALLALGAVVGCGDVALPERPEPYQFSIDCSIDGLCSSAAGDLKLIFSWPRHSLPVRIWAERRQDFPLHTARAIRLWMDASIYGEFSAVLVPDSQVADLIVLLGEPELVIQSSSDVTPLDCRGRTSIEVALDTTIALPFRITIVPRAGSGPNELNRCFPRAIAHEFGHALGLFLNSDDPSDIMFARPMVASTSLRDRATFATLYHTRPTVRLPDGR